MRARNDSRRLMAERWMIWRLVIPMRLPREVGDHGVENVEHAFSDLWRAAFQESKANHTDEVEKAKAGWVQEVELTTTHAREVRQAWATEPQPLKMH